MANAFRTLEVIGWQHAEPVLRSLAYALLKHDGKNPATDDLEPDRPGRKNAERVRNGSGRGSADRKPNPGLTGELVTALRTATADEMGDAVAKSGEADSRRDRCGTGCSSAPANC